MHGVAAEVTEEVIVLLQHDNPDPGAGKQQSVNKAGGTATGNTNLGPQNLCHGPDTTPHQGGFTVLKNRGYP